MSVGIAELVCVLKIIRRLVTYPDSLDGDGQEYPSY